MKCIHHYDDDGLCAAAIVRLYLKDRLEDESDFIMYKHGQDLILPENLNNEEVWYIVDLALDDVIYATIIKLLDVGCKVIHIDHHKSGIDYYNNLDESEKEKLKDVVRFYDVNASGCMLTFLYAQMDEDMRKHPSDMILDLNSDHSKYRILENIEEATPIYGNIPFVVRYIDDWDIQTGILPDTAAFHYGFSVGYSKRPCATIWMQLFTQERFTITPIINEGNVFTSIYERDNKRALDHGFETTLLGYKCFAVNSTSGDCRMFNPIRQNYDLCCKFSFDGSIQKWIYFFVSGKDNALDVCELARKFDGGGHAAAAGCQTDYIIFDDVIDNFDHIK